MKRREVWAWVVALTLLSAVHLNGPGANGSTLTLALAAALFAIRATHTTNRRTP